MKKCLYDVGSLLTELLLTFYGNASGVSLIDGPEGDNSRVSLAIYPVIKKSNHAFGRSKKVSIFVTHVVDNKTVRLASVSHFVSHVLCHFFLCRLRCDYLFHSILLFVYSNSMQAIRSRVFGENVERRLARSGWFASRGGAPVHFPCGFPSYKSAIKRIRFVGCVLPRNPTNLFRNRYFT